MAKFLEAEKKRQTDFKKTSPYFSDLARFDGQNGTRVYSHILPKTYVKENLYSEIRQSVAQYFANYAIQWHVQRANLCSSQICCINFLYPFATRPNALKSLLLPLYPTIKCVLPMEEDNRFLAFEWTGRENYLGEGRGNRRCIRGANCTSADAAVMFECNDGTRQIVLIEWKYTESYSGQSKEISPSGTDRKQIYAPLYQRSDCPLDKNALPNYASLFYDPFDQLMRQQFLSHEMERARELGASEVTVLHIAPQQNTDFLRVTSPQLIGLGSSAINVWKRIVKNNKFASIATEDLFGAFPIAEFPDLSKWWNYINTRYNWIK